MKVYSTETPLNSAVIAPLRPYVILGGGQDAMSVTTTSSRAGKFESRFWHKLFEEEVGRVKGHFGPINTLAVHPQGRAYASGAEDGFVRVHWVGLRRRTSADSSLTSRTSAAGRLVTSSPRWRCRLCVAVHALHGKSVGVRERTSWIKRLSGQAQLRQATALATTCPTLFVAVSSCHV